MAWKIMRFHIKHWKKEQLLWPTFQVLQKGSKDLLKLIAHKYELYQYIISFMNFTVSFILNSPRLKTINKKSFSRKMQYLQTASLSMKLKSGSSE